MHVVDVIPIAKGVGKEILSYFSAKKVTLGTLVTIPVRKKAIPGIVVALHDVSELKSQLKSSEYTLRNIVSIQKDSPLSPTFMKTCIQMKNYYATTTGMMITAYTPKIFFSELDIFTSRTPDESSSKTSILPERYMFQAPLGERIDYYKTLIRQQFAAKKSLFICVPSQAYAELLEQELSKGIEQHVYVFHGGFSAKRLRESLLQFNNDTQPLLVIGTVQFLLLVNQEKFSTVVTEFEGSDLYRRQERPFVDDRDFIYTYAHLSGITFIVADELLQLHTLAQSEKNYFTPLFPIHFRIKKSVQIEYLYPGEKEFTSSDYPLIARDIFHTIEMAVTENYRVVIFTPRKGLAPISLCQDCGTIVTDPEDGTPLVLQEITSHGSKARYYQNPRSKVKFPVHDVCSSCGGWRIKSFGIATKNVTQYIENNIPIEVPIFIIDSTETPTHARTKKTILAWQQSKSGILVTTEKSLAYVSPQSVPLVVVASLESLLAGSSYTAHEKLARVLLAFAEIASTKFIIQTREKDRAVVQGFQKKNLTDWYTSELEERKKFLFPPYGVIIKIETTGSDAIIVKREKILHQILDLEHKKYTVQTMRYRHNKLERSVTSFTIPASDWISLPANKQIPTIYKEIFTKITALPEYFVIHINPLTLL